MYCGLPILAGNTVTVTQQGVIAISKKTYSPISQHLVFLAGGVIRSEHFHGQAGTSELDGKHSVTDQETEHVRRYYTVLQPLLRIADIEKMFV